MGDGRCYNRYIISIVTVRRSDLCSLSDDDVDVDDVARILGLRLKPKARLAPKGVKIKDSPFPQNFEIFILS